MSDDTAGEERERLALILADISGDTEASEGYRLRADRILAAGFSDGFSVIKVSHPAPAATDPRDYAHIECDCVPDLGPSHCHKCGDAAGHPVAWADSFHGEIATATVEEVALALSEPNGFLVYSNHIEMAAALTTQFNITRRQT